MSYAAAEFIVIGDISYINRIHYLFIRFNLSSRMKLRQLYVKMGLCSLNNDPLDFKKNYQKIMESIQ